MRKNPYIEKFMNSICDVIRNADGDDMWRVFNATNSLDEKYVEGNWLLRALVSKIKGLEARDRGSWGKE
jgi:hypothetical protein